MADVRQPVITVNLQADGAEERVSLSERLIGFVFEDSDSKADRALLTLDNWDLSFFDTPLVVKGAELTVSWGYVDRMAPKRTLVIRRVKGFTTLQVEAQARSTLLNLTQKCRIFENMTRSQIAGQIASENGFFGDFAQVENTEQVFGVINQAGETDARLLTRLANREGFRFYIDHTGFHWHSRRFGEPPLRTYRYYTDPAAGDVESISVENDLSIKPGRVRVRARNPLTKQTIEAVGADSQTQRDTLGEVLEVVDPETGQTSITTIEKRTATTSVRASSGSQVGRLKREADARYRTSSRRNVQLTMRAVGDPAQAAKTVIEIQGISSFLSGKYFVTDVKHIIGAGYQMELKCRRAASGRIARAITRATQSAGTQNSASAKPASELRPIELVDPETGATRLVYRRGTE